MNDIGKSYFTGFDDPQHKPRISRISDDGEVYFKCSDGGLEQFGHTPEEAYGNLMNLRN